MNEEFEQWWIENKDTHFKCKLSANLLWSAANNQGIENAAKAMEHNSMHCAALIREIKEK